MKALGLLLVCGGCSLYFGPADEPPHSRPHDPYPDAGHPDGHYVDAVYPDAACSPDAPAPVCRHQVDVLGIYEPDGDHGAPHYADVMVAEPGVHTLVLASYEQTIWRVTVAPGAVVDAVHLYGYERSTVAFRGPVYNHSEELDGPACAYAYPDNEGGCSTAGLLARVAADAGEVHAFHGCYRASRWTLEHDGQVSSNCATDAGYRQTGFVRACGAP